GANLSKPISPAYPKLAGQYGDYLYATLRSYATVGNPNVGRSNPIMGAQVKQFKNAELRQLADYIASLPGEIFTVPDDRFR
ncbi:MAG TPA: cytochrome c4, partial [Rubrivivax sp.]|nr:cytochrome c4 [Rubrivivax sp.]